MRKTLNSLIVVASAALFLAGCAAALTGQTPERSATASPPIAAPTKWLPAGGVVHRDVAYGTDPNQKLDVYEPQDAANAPILLMVHGGGWKRGDKAASGVVDNKVAHYLPMGFIVVSTNYRLYPAVDPVTEAHDVASALAYVQQHAAEWGGSATDIVLMGHSAGANLVSLVAANSSIARDEGAAAWLGTVSLDSAAFNVVTIMTAPHLSLYDPVFGTDRQLWRDSSPTLTIDAIPAPMLLVCGSGRADSCPQAKAFATEVFAKYPDADQGSITVYPIDLRHGEINSLVGAPGPLTNTIDSFLESLGLKMSGASTG